MSSVRDVDHGSEKLIKSLKVRPTVRVGVIGSKASEAKSIQGGGSGVNTVADVARIHEFGIGVPRRSFIADWADEAEPEAKRRLRKAAERLITKGDLKKELELFGLWAQGAIQMRISSRIGPPLSKARVRQKGSDVPLIDTGQLRSSVTYEVDLG